MGKDHDRRTKRKRSRKYHKRRKKRMRELKAKAKAKQPSPASQPAPKSQEAPAVPEVAGSWQVRQLKVVRSESGGGDTATALVASPSIPFKGSPASAVPRPVDPST